MYIASMLELKIRSLKIPRVPATTIVANVINAIYHALTCTNVLADKKNVKVVIMNLTRTMIVIAPRKTASKIYLFFVCFRNGCHIITS